MSTGFSTYLNLLRFGAALVVLFSHIAYPRFSDGAWLWVRDLNLGSDAVVLFFVLSGFVIALTAERKDRTIGSFAFARATRILSVALPALVLGWVLDQWGASHAPDQYFAPYYAPTPLWEMLLRGLSFSNEWGGLQARLGSNGPYWSLSYEVAYYALFGVAFYLSGLRRAAFLILGVVVVGANILLLMPAWLMGVGLYHRLKAGPHMRCANAVVLCGLPLILYAVALRFDLPDLLRTSVQPHLPGHALRFSDEYLWNAVLGALFATHLAGMSSLLRNWSPGRLAPPAAWVAGASFSIYLIHYPLLQALHAAVPFIDPVRLLMLTLLLCLVFAECFERPLNLWRRLLRGETFRRDRRIAG